jgi:hypothetical protein
MCVCVVDDTNLGLIEPCKPLTLDLDLYLRTDPDHEFSYCAEAAEL